MICFSVGAKEHILPFELLMVKIKNGMQYAPIALFTYNRADHTKQAVESLLKNAEAQYSDLFIFSDGPKNEKAVEGVKKNREYLQSLKNDNDTLTLRYTDATITPYFRSVTIIEREKNWGLANSLIAGITEIVNKNGRVIVVEDDLILSPYFLRYMNEALEKYKDEDRVASISAFLNPIDCEAPETFFLRYFACWGWATWKRGWDILINDDRVLLKRLRWKKNDFNIGGTGPFYGILYCDKVGLNDSWAVRFYASQFLAGKLQLFPGRTMAIQTGTDGSGTHGTVVDHKYDGMQLSMEPIHVGDIAIEESKEMYDAFARFYCTGQKITFKAEWERFKSFIRRLIGIDYW